MSTLLQRVSKSALLAVAITCVTAGVKLLETDLYVGIVLLLIGIALIIAYAYLLEKQTVSGALKTLRRELAEK